ncbi:hypothetical protein EDF58_10639 [Novosphingobium sp. PhB57]|nr:hypothetical protein EDF58_10639 [Novosphingobium sp. PhB57]
MPPPGGRADCSARIALAALASAPAMPIHAGYLDFGDCAVFFPLFLHESLS